MIGLGMVQRSIARVFQSEQGDVVGLRRSPRMVPLFAEPALATSAAGAARGFTLDYREGSAALVGLDIAQNQGAVAERVLACSVGKHETA